VVSLTNGFTVAAGTPVLVISKTHAGNFTQGQQGAIYTATVTNQAGAGTTSGTVTVTETVPAGLALVSMAGTGWICGGGTCTRADVLNAGASYPPITVIVNVAPNAPSQLTNQVTVSGGGLPAGISGYDPTTIQTAQVVICLGEPNNQILNPIAADGSSVFFQGLPVLARFRDCDNSGKSVNTPGLVTNFRLVAITSGTTITTVNQAVPSATPRATFQWDPLLKDWVFLINTRSLAKGNRYSYRITLNDASTIDFSYKVK
jgi:uncharacterized repeat protein (TIGR01451 family)